MNETPASYKNFNSGEPNDAGGSEDYVHLFKSGKWNDINDNSLFACTICESTDGRKKRTVHVGTDATTKKLVRHTWTDGLISCNLRGDGYPMVADAADNKALTDLALANSNCAAGNNMHGVALKRSNFSR